MTGVSGSEKSTLILHTLYNTFNLILNKNKSRKVPKAFTGFKGTELIDKIIDIDQSPIGRTQGQILLHILVHLDRLESGLLDYPSQKLEDIKSVILFQRKRRKV